MFLLCFFLKWRIHVRCEGLCLTKVVFILLQCFTLYVKIKTIYCIFEVENR